MHGPRNSRSVLGCLPSWGRWRWTGSAVSSWAAFALPFPYSVFFSVPLLCWKNGANNWTQHCLQQLWTAVLLDGRPAHPNSWWTLFTTLEQNPAKRGCSSHRGAKALRSAGGLRGSDSEPLTSCSTSLRLLRWGWETDCTRWRGQCVQILREPHEEDAIGFLTRIKPLRAPSFLYFPSLGSLNIISFILLHWSLKTSAIWHISREASAYHAFS